MADDGFPRPGPFIDNEGREMYQMEGIVGSHWKSKGVFEYRVAWEGYPESEWTWEPFENVLYSPAHIHKYHRRFWRSPRPSQELVDCLD